MDSDPDFSDLDPDFDQIRIRTWEKSPIRVRTKGPGSATLVLLLIISLLLLNGWSVSLTIPQVPRGHFTEFFMKPEPPGQRS